MVLPVSLVTRAHLPLTNSVTIHSTQLAINAASTQPAARHRLTSLISQQLPHWAPHNSTNKYQYSPQYQTQTPVPLQSSNDQDSARRIYHTPVNIQYHVSILTKLADSATHPLHHLSLWRTSANEAFISKSIYAINKLSSWRPKRAGCGGADAMQCKMRCWSLA